MYDTVLTQCVSQVCYIRKQDLCKNKYLHGKMDRALDYESRGQEFESSRARHFPSMMQILHSSLIVI